jgi:putative methyltransferase (TIGR04325 family)
MRESFLKKLLPWHIRRTLAAARRHFAARKPPFAGTYARFGDVPSSPPWNAPPWVESSRRFAEKKRREVGRPLPDGIAPSKTSLPVLATVLAGTQADPLRILDFGGAAGVDYANLLASLGNAAPGIRYHVVDTVACCDAGRKIWADDGRISFGPDLPGAAERFDIVYSSNAIHLIEDFRGLLRTFSRYEPAAILLCKTCMYDGPSFARRQVNMGRGAENPIWALGIREVEQAMEENGYVLTFRGYDEESHNVDNYASEHRAGRMVSLLFMRRRARPADAPEAR